MKLHGRAFSSSQRSRAGFTLIEILIAVVVVGLVLTAIASALTTSVKNAAESRYRTRASTLGQEAMEFYTREKTVLGWGEFLAVIPDNPTSYCLVTFPTAGALAALPSGACQPTQTINEAGVNFTREAEITKGLNDVTVQINVKWIDGSRTPTVTLARVFRKTDL